MGRALDLAARALGHTSPNPVVGAVVVRDGEAVGEGWHARAGDPHAEAVALGAAGDRARGATLYVTLEPCNHHGRTPPCARAVLEAGVRRVVCAVGDPNPRVEGGGCRWLAERGVDVTSGVLEDEARRLNRFFFKWVTTGRPFVTSKTAMTLDGRVATREGSSRWITSAAARARVHEERALHDAVLVGAGTVMADDPRLTVRLEAPDEAPRWYRVPPTLARPPLRVVVDSHGRVPPTARVLDVSAGPVVLCVGAGVCVDAPRAGGVEVLEAPTVAGRVDLRWLLRALAERGVLSVFVEGGPTLHAALLDAGLSDRLLAFVAPIGVGGRGALPAVRWTSAEAGEEAEGERTPGLALREPIMVPLGPDLMLDAERTE